MEFIGHNNSLANKRGLLLFQFIKLGIFFHIRGLGDIKAFPDPFAGQHVLKYFLILDNALACGKDKLLSEMKDKLSPVITNLEKTL